MVMMTAAHVHTNRSNMNANAGLRRRGGQKSDNKNARNYAFHLIPVSLH